MNTKTFPKARVCVLDVYPAFEQGLKKALDFASKHNIHTNTPDGMKLIFGFCLEAIEAFYKSINSPYQKVICIGTRAKTKKLQEFIEKNFENFIKHFPVPYCGRIDINSPDLEVAAENSLKQQKSKRNFQKITSKLKIKQL